MNTYKIILAGFFLCCINALYGQEKALEYQVGLHQITLRHIGGTVHRPDGDNFAPRFGLLYYHRLSKNAGVKTGLQLIIERREESRWYDDSGPMMPQNIVIFQNKFEILAIDIPVNFRIEFNQGNPRVFWEMGVSLNIYWKERNEYIFRGETPAVLEGNIPPEKFIAYDHGHQVGVPFFLSMGLRYDLNDKFGLMVQPFLNIDATRTGRDPDDEYTFLPGVQMGFVQFL